MIDRKILTQHLIWFVISLVAAFLIWLVALNQADPVGQRAFRTVAVTIEPDEGLLLANEDTVRRTVDVFVRAQQSTLDLLVRDDIVVRALLEGLPPGAHQAQVQAQVSRNAVADTSPAQIAVNLVERRSQQKAIELEIISEPPVGYARGDVVFSENQVLVSGTLEQVESVEVLHVPLDLADQRESYSFEIEPIPVDNDGEVVDNVTVAQSIRVDVEIFQREDELAIAVRPNVDPTGLPAGYTWSLGDFFPETVSVQGAPADLARLPELLDTEEISLDGRTESFETTVEVIVDGDDVVVTSGQSITVNITISPIPGQKIVDEVPVRFIGLGSSLEARAIPSRVSAVVTGPEPVLQSLTADNIEVIVDLTNLGEGSFDQSLTATVNTAGAEDLNVNVLPGEIGVIITSTRPTLAPTPTADDANGG